MADHVNDAAKAAGGENPSSKHDKTKKPVSEAVWTKARPVMHGIADVRDSHNQMPEHNRLTTT